MDTAFLLAYSFGQFFWGDLGDRVSAKRTVTAGMYGVGAVVGLYTAAAFLGLSPGWWLGAAFFLAARCAP
jgi:MFS family permease